MPKAKHREHGQIKKNVGLVLTEDAIAGLDEIAKQFQVSRSHLLEMVGRKQIEISPPDSLLGE